MKQVINWFKNHLRLLKLVFLIAVAIVVIGELLSIGKTISFSELEEIFKSLPVWKIFAMLVIGLFSVAPMTGYDFTLNKMLALKNKPAYIFETSWIINTINNIAGFGGLISIGLRSEFYGKNKTGKDVVSALSKILVFLMAGLSIYSLAAFFMVVVVKVNVYLQQYWIWLIAGGLYFPIVYLFIRFKKTGLLGGLSQKHRWSLIATSFFEWSGVLATFLSIGYFLEVQFPIWEVIPLFAAASVIGIVSMIPGSLGSFDLMMIIGLSAVGINREVVVLWLLLFRIFYYLVPFIIGLVLFFKHTASRIDDRYSGIPKQLAMEIAHKIVVALLYFSGIMMVLLATIPEAFQEFRWLEFLNPFRYHIIVQFPSIVLGFSLIIMGRGVAERVRRAYWPTILLIALALGYSILFDFSMISILYLFVLLLIIIFSKPELYRKQLVYSWEAKTKDGLVFGTLVILYVIIGVYNLPKITHHRYHLPEFFLFPSEQIWLTGFVAIFIVVLFILFFISYLSGEKQIVGEKLDQKRVQHILNTYGGNSDSELVFLGDKTVFLYNDGKEDTVFLQFSTHNNKCVVMGDPSGKKADFAYAIEAFISAADLLNYQPVFYEAHEETVMILHEFGYDFIKMGEEGLVDLSTFTTSGKKMKGTRASVNKIVKDGYTFEVLKPPFSDAQLTIFKEISDSWLQGKKEKGFSLGFFSEDYLQRTEIAVVKNQQEEVVAFANIIPTYTDTIGTIDLMRHHLDKAPSGSMDFLFLNLFDYLKAHGIRYFNLGMAPLSNVGQSRKSFIQERIASLVYEFGSHFYSFQGLRDYKEKYAAIWNPRYTLYSRDSWIAYVVIALLIIDNKPVDSQVTRLAGIRKILNRQFER